jgi:HK97 family phage major capsid protein
MHPREWVKFSLAKSTTGEYLFAGADLAGRLGASIVLDANIPTNLGAGTNETVMIVGAFKAGAFFFEREPLRIDTSSDAGFFTDETVFRAEERYGFAVVQPSAFELLTGITP